MGLILQGINNIYLVKTEDGILECRIKGKILGGDKTEYNPLAPGDRVEIEADADHAGCGQIISRYSRSSHLGRWNKKRRCDQVLAANLDYAVCVLSPDSPPFRPRFADRVLLACEIGGVQPLIVMNKIDQGISERVRERLDDFERIGYPVLYCSALTGDGLEKLDRKLEGRMTAFTGQSGVGKSSLLNALIPGIDLRTGGITDKYNRGKHTTCFALALEKGPDTWVVDTPGIREIEVAGIEPEELSHYFPEMEPLINECGFSGCTHNHEPDCAVQAALERGEIHTDRFNSYLALLESLEERVKKRYGQT